MRKQALPMAPHCLWGATGKVRRPRAPFPKLALPITAPGGPSSAGRSVKEGGTTVGTTPVMPLGVTLPLPETVLSGTAFSSTGLA